MPATTEGRLGQLEQKGAVVAQQISDISRTIDRLVPYGEALVELRGTVSGLREDVADIRAEIASARQAATDFERQRQAADDARKADRKADRRLQWQIAAGIATTLIALIVGSVLGAHP